MITRRKFITTTSLSALSLAFMPRVSASGPAKKNIGLQLYTVRDHIGNDLSGTLEQIAKIGYTWLEAAGYSEGKFYGLKPSEFKNTVEDLGMTLVSSHVGFSPEQSRQVVDAHLELGVPYIVYPWISMPEIPSADDYLRAAELFNRLGEACRKDGLKFGYHNHDFEFRKIGETTGFDILLQSTDPGLVCFEADIYWMHYANIDVRDYLRNYSGRFHLWHVKDMSAGNERSFTEVGEGIINYREYFEDLKDISGMKYFFVEQDKCDRDSMESVEISYRNLKKII